MENLIICKKVIFGYIKTDTLEGENGTKAFAKKLVVAQFCAQAARSQSINVAVE